MASQSSDMQKLYICDRRDPTPCGSECTAKKMGLRLDDASVCSYTSDISHSLTASLGVAPSWSVDDANGLAVETTKNLVEQMLVIPVTDIQVEGGKDA